MGNNSLVIGGAGVVLVVVGSILLVGGTGPFLVGLVVLLAGVGFVVHLLLRLTGGGPGRAAEATSEAVANATGTRFFAITGMNDMSAMSQWVAGGLAGVLALAGLFLYSRASDGMFGVFGGLLFLFGLAVVIVLVHKATDYSHEAHAHAADDDDSRPDQGSAAA